MSDTTQDHHVLTIEDESGSRTLILKAATYSLGRDSSNGIVIKGKGVSRQHALLLRLPAPNGYQYRVVDGNSEGKASANGVLVNGKRSNSHNLKHRDEIYFGSGVRAVYEIVSMENSQFIQYLEPADYQSIKSSPKTSTSTTISEEDSQEQTLFNQVIPPELSEGAVAKSPVEQPAASTPNRPWWIIGVVAIILIALGAGLLLNREESSPPPEPASQEQS
ncbi:FHA domain-containing protein [Candidatus Synechococcus calcipolaris G9]|uniref:FHA domain-containing protein n=1 Tax=Candidatus Synechococcus calcipolaris G9 TaxID=1497997 RepID=A0ABT6EYY5_9SYNE|nr:FHA domain-containing protein [Candidatus Synechococcus calcipolaris]MDG2990787.1 FHA domain-containing protein [Candidatus Synechococcus calcipolaris G9]